MNGARFVLEERAGDLLVEVGEPEWNGFVAGEAFGVPEVINETGICELFDRRCETCANFSTSWFGHFIYECCNFVGFSLRDRNELPAAGPASGSAGNVSPGLLFCFPREVDDQVGNFLHEG